MKRNRMLFNVRNGHLVLRTAFTAAAVLLSSLVIPAVSPAVSLSGDSRTYVQSRETADNLKILGGYEYLDFDVQNAGKETISFHTGGWLRYDFRDEQSGSKTNSDLQYAYLSFKSREANTAVNLGRVMVFEGVAAERVDGILARTDLAGGFSVSGFGGSPVETGIELPGNDFIYGARLSHQLSDLYRIGLSALKEEKNSLDYRREQGVDVWLHPLSKVDIAGRSSYNDITKGWMEHSYHLTLGPFEALRLDTSASWINYDDYFFRTTTTAFDFRPGVIDIRESVRILGETVSYAFTDRLNASAEYRKFAYDLAGDANRAGISVAYSIPRSYLAGVSFHRMDGEADRLSYNQYRAYAFKKMDKVDATLDLLLVKYDEAINRVTNAISASLALGYELTQALRLGFDAEYAKNPDFDKDVRMFAKIIYHFDVERGSGRKEGGR